MSLIFRVCNSFPRKFNTVLLRKNLRKLDWGTFLVEYLVCRPSVYKKYFFCVACQKNILKRPRRLRAIYWSDMQPGEDCSTQRRTNNYNDTQRYECQRREGTGCHKSGQNHLSSPPKSCDSYIHLLFCFTPAQMFWLPGKKRISRISQKITKLQQKNYRCWKWLRAAIK